MTINSLKKEALQIRKIFLKMHYEAKSGHIGTGLSSIDMLTYLYSSFLQQNDKFILSKGHGASALYATLNYFEKINDEILSTYYKDGTLLPAHPAPKALKEIPIATGSLGHGLPVSTGLAYGFKILDKNTNKVICMLSDGELNEGSNWEAIMFAGHNKLNNLVMIIDANGLQGFGKTADVINLEPLKEKLENFGFFVNEINGHDFSEIINAFTIQEDKSLCILMRTIKGKGVSYMENKLEWHYLPMNEEQYKQAATELLETEKDLQ